MKKRNNKTMFLLFVATLSFVGSGFGMKGRGHEEDKNKGMFAAVLREVMRAQEEAAKKARKGVEKKERLLREMKKARRDLVNGSIIEYIAPGDNPWSNDGRRFTRNDIEVLDELIGRHMGQKQGLEGQEEKEAEAGRELRANIATTFSSAMANTMRMEAERELTKMKCLEWIGKLDIDEMALFLKIAKIFSDNSRGVNTDRFKKLKKFIVDISMEKKEELGQNSGSFFMKTLAKMLEDSDVGLLTQGCDNLNDMLKTFGDLCEKNKKK